MTQKQSMSLLVSSKSNDWNTPPEYIEAAREVMGGIGLDPASNEIANRIVRADKFFTEEDDGLSMPWISHSVFLNSPYGKTRNKSNQEIWADKMLREYALHNFGEGILLTKVVPGYEWFDILFCDLQPTVCITRGRIAFIRPEWITEDGTVNYPKGDNRSKAASAFWYIGNDDRKFAKVFRKFGRIIPGICTRIH